MDKKFCNYPDCNCPFDHPGTAGWCARGLFTPPSAPNSPSFGGCFECGTELSADDNGRVAELEAEETRIAVMLAAKLRRIAALEAQLAASREREGRMREALRLTRYCLQQANEAENGPIRDTIWFSPFETLFDYMDAALAVEKGE